MDGVDGAAVAGRGAVGAERLLDVRRCRAGRRRGMDAAAIRPKELEARGVETRPFFLGMHEQPAFHRQGLFLDERYPVAETLARQGLYLPSGLALTDEQLSTGV